MHAEQELANFLDKFFHNKVNEISNTKKIKNDKEQYEGIDIMGEYNANTIFIDKKGYLSILNLGPTFALEVSFLNPDKKRVEGWLFDSNKKQLIIYYVGNNLPGISDTPILHIRPSSQYACYYNDERLAMELPSPSKWFNRPDNLKATLTNFYMTKQAWWLNSDYMYKQVKDLL